MKVAIKAIPADPRDRIKGGGAKYAVREVRDHLQGNRFVLRTDVKSFYVSILNQFPKFVAFRSKHPRRGNYLDRDLGGCELKWVALGTIGYKSARRAFNCTLPVLRCTELLQPNDVKGQTATSRDVRVTAALPLEADVRRRGWRGSFGLAADSCAATSMIIPPVILFQGCNWNSTNSVV